MKKILFILVGLLCLVSTLSAQNTNFESSIKSYIKVRALNDKKVKFEYIEFVGKDSIQRVRSGSYLVGEFSDTINQKIYKNEVNRFWSEIDQSDPYFEYVIKYYTINNFGTEIQEYLTLYCLNNGCVYEKTEDIPLMHTARSSYQDTTIVSIKDLYTSYEYQKGILTDPETKAVIAVFKEKSNEKLSYHRINKALKGIILSKYSLINGKSIETFLKEKYSRYKKCSKKGCYRPAISCNILDRTGEVDTSKCSGHYNYSKKG